jgi:hypothetical protein
LKIVHDRVNYLGLAFVGLSIGCAGPMSSLPGRARADLLCAGDLDIRGYGALFPPGRSIRDRLVGGCGQWALYAWICWRGDRSRPAWCTWDDLRRRNADGCTWCLVKLVDERQCSTVPPKMNYPVDIGIRACD